MQYTLFPSPLGEVLLAGRGGSLCRIMFMEGEAANTSIPADWQRDETTFTEAKSQVLGYLEGRRRSFSLDLAPDGSEFQRQVWAALLRIPYGQTRTYGELARRLGRQGAARAIGAANRANPLPVVIPCHRVVAASDIGGYSGGKALKRQLLALEGIRA
ncbi:methylated-DNA--[protein]-cysteine S-methyltransferase [Aidingimonas lacisalsi]|uniref:methylated-DNA--[protein]-cysteine S-methyltransferase n=1 Tax=Aidingimonas lacisalsi TaxID=2604086 RepID=UPI0011D2996A|nr:methylated-DNA--[protein]-cysteine S-methyltransferase [Aidingimonas lacisalsi]